MSIEAIYTAESTATGGGRDGHVKSSDGHLDLETRPPKAMGGSGDGTNPEQLFSAGYAACFLSALRLVAGRARVKVPDATDVTVKIGIGRTAEGGFGLTGDIVVNLPGLDQNDADDLVDKAHHVCPYSLATRGNVDVGVSAKV
ncbi:MAG: organic hydroperoxide resistance protein [Mycobacterium sp.]|uniref:organic hydroperoxide resistance protein n=1 Tax=Mycobacterium sp. TaxID=1785 RepID=UPI003CC64B42